MSHELSPTPSTSTRSLKSRPSSGVLDSVRDSFKTLLPSNQPQTPSSRDSTPNSFFRQPINSLQSLEDGSYFKDSPKGKVLTPLPKSPDIRESRTDGMDPHATTFSPDLQRQLHKLDSTNSLEQRRRAAWSISQHLDNYPIQDIAPIWRRAEDLLERTNSAETFKAVCALLLACARHRPLEPREKHLFFSIILSHTSFALDFRLKLLSELSNHGRDIHGLDVTRFSSLLCWLIRRSFDFVRTHRGPKSNSQTSNYNVDRDCLEAGLKLLLTSIKFNAKLLEPVQLREITDNIIFICEMATSQSDFNLSLDILEAIFTYSALPEGCLRPCVEVLCGGICSSANLHDRSLSTFDKLLASHHRSEILDTLIAILDQVPDDLGSSVMKSKKRIAIVARGAVHGLHHMSDRGQQDSRISLRSAVLLAALEHCVQNKSSSLRRDVLRLIDELLHMEGVNESLFEEKTWQQLSGTIVACTNVDDLRAQYRQVDHQSAESRSEEKSEHNTSTVHPDAIEKNIKEATAILNRLMHFLSSYYEEAEFDHKIAMLSLLLRVVHKINDDLTKVLTDSFAKDQLIYPPHPDWLENCQKLREAVLTATERSTESRLNAVEVLNSACNIAEAFNFEQTRVLVLDLAESVMLITTPDVLERLCEILVYHATWTIDDSLAEEIVARLEQIVLSNSIPKTTSNEDGKSITDENFPNSDKNAMFDAPVGIVARALVSMFLRNMNRSSKRSTNIFNALISIAKSNEVLPWARIIALKVLVRLRSDIKYSIYLVPHTDSENLAATLCRTAATATRSSDGRTMHSRVDEGSSKARNQARSTGSPRQSRTSSAQGRNSSVVDRVSVPTPPLWVYPGPKGLPEDPPSSSSNLIYSHVDTSESEISSSTAPHSTLTTILKSSMWLELVLELLQRKNSEWETYSYIIVHLGSQLTNHSLFVNAIPQIKFLRSVLCQQLHSKEFLTPPSFTNLKKSDVAVCLYQILTMLISYRAHFSKNEEDEMVRLFTFGIGTWDYRTTEACFNALSICCHEMPASTIKYLQNVLSKISQIITQPNLAVHILEFLAALARLPELFRNFAEEHFKNVFMICFRYLQSSRDQREKAAQSTGARNSKASSIASRVSREGHNSADSSWTPIDSLADVLPQYVHALAFHVITYWYMAIKLQDRASYMKWIRGYLIYKDTTGQDVMEEQAQVTVDMMNRVAYTDREEYLPLSSFANMSDGEIVSKSYLIGMSILTVQNAVRTGVTQLIFRRPSGTKYTVTRPQLTKRPRHQVPISSSSMTEETGSSISVLPEEILQSLYSPLDVYTDESSLLSEMPVSLPSDESTDRAIRFFDFISPLDGHKVGIIYIGEDQTTEAEILANVMGSADYMAFLNGIGTLTELKDATFNTQGLDRSFDSDGKFTYCWRNRVTELVFHVTTMMPTNLDSDPVCAAKKRHIGNNYVNVIFNNSGHSFDFETFPSDFNYVNIVITPEARASFLETRLNARELYMKTTHKEALAGNQAENTPEYHEKATNELFYKVTVMTKPGLPRISPAADTKTVSGSSLPAFVRLLALNASLFSQVWAARGTGEYVSSWKSRLREINRLRQKHAPPAPPPPPPQQQEKPKTGSTPDSGKDKGPSGRTSRDSSLLRRSSFALMFTGDGTNRSSGVSGATDMERSSSAGSYE